MIRPTPVKFIQDLGNMKNGTKEKKEKEKKKIKEERESKKTKGKQKENRITYQEGL